MMKKTLFTKNTCSESLKELFADEEIDIDGGETVMQITDSNDFDAESEDFEASSKKENVSDQSHSLESEWDTDDDDLLLAEFKKKESQIPAGDYLAKVSKVSAAKVKSQYGGEYTQVTLLFTMQISSNKELKLPFKASNNLNPRGRLYPAVTALLGAQPPDSFNLRQLEGKSATVTVAQNEDMAGNVWDNIVDVKKAG